MTGWGRVGSGKLRKHLLLQYYSHMHMGKATHTNNIMKHNTGAKLPRMGRRPSRAHATLQGPMPLHAAPCNSMQHH